MSKKNDLLTTEAAGEALRIDEAEIAELIESGDLRKIWHRSGNSAEAPLESYLLGADVKRLKQQSDPKYLARLVAGEVTEPDDDDDTPRSLAESVPRF